MEDTPVLRRRHAYQIRYKSTVQIWKQEYGKLWEAYEKLGAEYEQLRAAYEKGVSENKEGKKEFGSLASTVTNFFWRR